MSKSILFKLQKSVMWLLIGNLYPAPANMEKLYVLYGYPFAGKSTLTDALIMSTMIILKIIGKSVIAGTVAHTKVSRDALRKIAEECRAEAVILYVNTSVEVVRKRWQENRVNRTRFDVRGSDFNTVINDFDLPDKSENVITITNSMTIEDVYKAIEA